MDTITINIDILKQYKISMNEYLCLLKIYLIDKGEEIPFRATKDDLYTLEQKKYITHSNDGKTILFTKKATNIFEPETDLFEEFYTLFPTKVMAKGSMRVLSTNSVHTSSAMKTKKIWRRICMSKKDIQETIIKGLKTELAYRERGHSLGYMQNIDTWLRQSTWEKWISFAPEKEKEERCNTKSNVEQL